MLPLEWWAPREMDTSATAIYHQTVEMTEPQLSGVCTWIYQQYGDVMTLQICIIMLW